MDTPPNIFRRRDGESDLIQRILRRGRASEDDATKLAATAADESPTAMPEQAAVPAMPATPKPGVTPTMAADQAPALTEIDVPELEGKPVSTPDEVEFDETQSQMWRGGGNYYYKYTPASGNKPATIQMHGGRYNRENPVTISETGSAAEAFAAIMAEGRRMSAAGQAGQYITPQQYAKQRRDAGIASGMNENERAVVVSRELMEEAEAAKEPKKGSFGSTGRPVSASQLRIAEIEGSLADKRDAEEAARNAGTDTPPPAPADPFATSPRPNLGTSERPLEATAEERAEYEEVVNVLTRANPYFIASQGSILLNRINNPALRERARKVMVALSENP